MITTNEIVETIKMIQQEKLDIRTITMGISLRDCSSESAAVSCNKIYDKICKNAQDLLKVGQELESIYGIPIINKRVSVSPISQVAESSDTNDYTAFAIALDKAAAETGVDFIGGFSALVHKGYTKGDTILIDSLPSALSQTQKVCASVNVATTRAGTNLTACGHMGRIIKEIAEATAHNSSIGCAKFVVFANAVEDNPFMAGSFLGVGEAECVINVGVSGPGVVKSALEKAKDASISEVAEIIKRTAFKITRVGQLIGQEASKRLNVPFGIVDLSLAPTPAIGDSVAHILEEVGVEKAGAHGTTAILALLNDAVKKGGVMASGFVGGLSGAFIPVSEDAGMIDACSCGALTIDKLEAMTAVCSVGLDMIAVAGDTPAETIAAIIADEAAIGVINSKTTAVRIIPAVGYKVGDMVSFGGLLGMAPVIKLNEYGSERFINRAGQIPAPIHSLKN